MNIYKAATAALGAISIAAVPTIAAAQAANPAGKLSISGKARAGAKLDKRSRLDASVPVSVGGAAVGEGGGFGGIGFALLAAGVAAAVGIAVASSGSSRPASP